MFCDCNGHLVWAEIAWRELALAAPVIPCGTAIRSGAESSADAITIRQIFTEHTRKDRLMTAPLSAAKAIADTLTQSGFDVLSPAWVGRGKPQGHQRPQRALRADHQPQRGNYLGLPYFRWRPHERGAPDQHRAGPAQPGLG